MRSILQLGLMVLLLLGAGNRVWGKVAVGQTIAERGFAGSDVLVSVVDTPPVLMSAGEAAARGYNPAVFEDGPNVYAYVKQNPWTAWDPHGLEDKKNQPSRGKLQSLADGPGLNPKLFPNPDVGNDPKSQDAEFERQNKMATVHHAQVMSDPEVVKGMNQKSPPSIEKDKAPVWAGVGVALVMPGMTAKGRDDWNKAFAENYTPGTQQGLNYIAGAAAVGLFALEMRGEKSGGVKTPLWSTTKKKTSVQNAFSHWKDHGPEFPEFQNAKQYVEGAKSFFNKPPAGTLTKSRDKNGDTLFYHPTSNTFGVRAADGAPRTLFRPTDNINYWNKQ